jgi:hypothetical protein
MTVLNRISGMDRPAHLVLRLTTLIFAVLLGLQCVWLLAAEVIRPGIQLPTDIASAVAAAKHRDAAALAASIGVFRGDLWAEAAYTNADLLWGEKAVLNKADVAKRLPAVRANLERSLDDGPLQSSAWLLLAGLAARFPSLNLEATEPLRMSYYTGPSEQRLVPLRLLIAAHLDKFSDIEMRELAGRDIRLLLARKQKSAVAEAYGAASAAGRSYIEQTIKDTDPSALDAIKSSTRKPSLPD